MAVFSNNLKPSRGLSLELEDIMHFQTFLLLVFFSSLSQQSNELDFLSTLKARNVLIHGREDDLSYCFGTDSICVESNHLFDSCNAFSGASDLTQWYQCICGNGYVTSEME